jgi:hypothetical protein
MPPKSFDQQLESLLRFDKIRLYKLTELSQYSILACFIAMFVGSKINKYLIPEYSDDEGIVEKVVYLMWNLILMMVSLYYIRKIVLMVPYIFSFDTDYVVSRGGESLLGFSVGFAIVFGATQTNFRDRFLFT